MESFPNAYLLTKHAFSELARCKKDKCEMRHWYHIQIHNFMNLIHMLFNVRSKLVIDLWLFPF